MGLNHRQRTLLSSMLTVSFLFCTAQFSASSVQSSHDPYDASGGSPDSSRACTPVPITVPMCQRIRYNTTSDRLPHGKQSDAAASMKLYDDLVKVPCAPYLNLFVCSMHLPFCNREQGLLVRPCREFCMRIRDLCTPVLLRYGYHWPESLSCDLLESENGSGDKRNLCLIPKDEEFNITLKKMQIARLHDDRLSGNSSAIHPKDPQLPPNPSISPVPPPRSSSPSRAEIRQCSSAEVRLGPEPNSSCAPRCHASLHFFAEDKQFASAWMLVWSTMCLICTSLAVATFLLDGDRFCFPERPIVWVAVCYCLYSIAHILRVILGPELSCSSHQADGKDTYRVSRYAGHWCAALFLLLYFSWLAGLLWWLALTICWYLCAVKKWAQEALSAKSVWLHLIAWGVPLLVSVLLLVLHRIEADELTHLCVVDGSRPANLMGFIIVPCALTLALGLAFLSCALCSTVTVREHLKWSGNQGFRRLEKLMTKICLFSFLFVLPTLCVLAASVYEFSERDRWTASLEKVLSRPECVSASGLRTDSGDGCIPEHKPSSVIYMLKIFMSLSSGLPSGLVVWANGKSAAAWRNCFCRVILRRKGSSWHRRPAAAAAAAGGGGNFAHVASASSAASATTAGGSCRLLRGDAASSGSGGPQRSGRFGYAGCSGTTPV